ncbi:hypothetical protein EG339_23160 [Chryseobacterium bernardetii]|uniref:Uncharacterized protein n=1 Tax=Chryseobacterium bernardetii TaxID=1241978 RepID=A0A3G6TDF3_9FLAO|nr:hypothetical protein [Chryseobacterium bernardetii]AZB27278.1 hypothetical protein EG339_23160 [Chryseobacterium bernardetii]
MSFLKNHNYISSNGLINSSTKSQGNVMQVGNIDLSGLITVLDESGNLKWNRAFKSPQGGYTTFVKVMPFKNGDFAVVGVTAYKTPLVMKIKGTGEVLWCKVFPSIETDERRIFADILGDSMIYLTFHSVNTKTSGTLLLNGWEGKVDSRTDIINNGTPGATLEVTGISTYSEIVHISANETLNGVTRGVSFYGQVNEPVMTAQYPSVSGIPVALNGVYCRPGQQGGYELHLGGKINNIPVLLAPNDRAILFKDWDSQSVKFIHGKDFFYATTGAGYSFCYSGYDYNPVWTQHSLIKGFYIDQIIGNEVTVRGVQNSDFTGLVGSAINTCFTSSANNINVSKDGYKLQDAPYISNKVDFKEEDLNFDIITKPYTNENACGTNGGDGTEITFNEFSGLQTPNFYLQAAGSRGEDSTKGIHLRWGFGGKLGENHLPKGNLADNKNNFNKPDDFVKVYRTLYEKKIFNLEFTQVPQLIDESKKMWVYKFNNDSRIFYVYFKNKTKYAQVRQSVNPMADPVKFMEQYGNEIVEVLCKTDIFFAAELRVENQQSDSVVELEALSVADSNNLSQQYLSYRAQPYSFNGLANTYFNAENGKTLRFRPNHCLVTGIKFEFYSDFIISRNQANAWKLMGEFSLTDERDRVFDRLDPLPGENPVHGAWLRYNDGAYVNTENYRMKWEHASTGPLDRDIQTVVKRYVELSNDQQNPKANETISINLSPTGSQQVVGISTNLPKDGDMQVSNLDILNIAALDYHVARMLGLGYLDIKDDVFGNEYIYITEYYTNQNLDINSGEKTYQLLSMSLPVSTEIERLSLPVKLMKLNKGMDSNNPQSAGLYDAEGYSHNGKYRYISIYNNQVPELEVNPTFMGDSQEFNASSFTFPVYAGLEYRVVEPGKTDDYQWIKPELCHDTKYANIDNVANSFETLPLQIPDTYAPLYMHKQDKSGTYFYKGYGINWFSRAQIGGEELSIETKIKPNNRLLPPTATTAFLIQKEYPVTLTSQGEQDRRNAITDSDKTLVRLGFDHHIYQDEIVYSIPFDSTLQDSYYLAPDTIFPDDKEVIADEVEIFYRNYTMREISAKVSSISHHPNNQLLAEIKTVDYTLPSSGGTIAPGSSMPAQPSIPLQILKSEIPAGTTINDFIGGIFLLDGESYIINGITVESTGLKFTVFKKAPSAAIIAGTSPVIDQSSLVLPTFSPGTEGLFSATENMQNTPTWGPKNPNSLKMKIGTNDWTIHREIIHTQQSDGSVQRFLEKSRGFWKNAQVHRHYEEITKYQNSQGVIIDNPAQGKEVHRGVYKITFPGFKLAQHPQFSAASNSVEWFNGIVRMFTYEHFGAKPSESRSIFKVVRTENIGTNKDLVLYVYDENFEIKEDDQHKPLFVFNDGNDFPVKMSDPLMGNDVEINYYPSYRIYLYKNEANNLTEDATLPPDGEDVRYSMFGFKSVDNDNVDMQGAKYKSKFSVPAIMFANRIVDPKPPRKPKGSMYATRPDKFGKSTYSFITEYDHKPYSVQFFRANNAVLLASLYEPLKIEEIKNRLNALGGNDEEFFTDRWMNFVDFEMLLNTSATAFEAFPPDSPVKYALPLPNSKILFDAINYFIVNHNKHFGLQIGQNGYANLLDETKWENGQYPINYRVIGAITGQSDELRLGHFIKEAMINCFLPLTEVPIIYQQIHNFDFNDLKGHRPKNKKQNIRDASGYLLPTNHADFDMAPMAAIYSQGQGGTAHSTLFTDFTLDGASDNFYFYGVRELGNQLQMGEFSKFQGPIKLVNTNPAEPPKILSLLPVVDNATLGIPAKVRIEVNSYTDVHKINEISIYRATNKLDADSILSMKHIKTVKIADVEVNPENDSWTVYDEFEDLDEKPYGDPLFYRVVASRKVEYTTIDYNVSPPAAKTVQEQAPSLPSKTTVTMLVENYNPPAPVLRYHSEPVDSDVINWVILSWDQVCYKGKYHLYKMSQTGNWKEIARIDTDEKDTSKAKLYRYGNNPATNKEEWFLTETFDMTGNEFFLPVEKLELDPMKIKDAEGRVLYHHFKMVSQNTSNMFSTEEKILTIYKEETWTDIGGISHDGTDGMILQGTFIVRP